MALDTKRDRLLLILAGIFITSAITAELISSKVFQFHLFGKDFYAVVGILPWPVVFLVTDIINEYYGRKVVRRLSIITSILIAYAFILVTMAMEFNTVLPSPTDKEYENVFGQSRWIIVGSITAFIVSQLIDSFIFWKLRNKTGKGMIWLRATGSTVISQLIDSFIVLYIGFVLPGKLPDGVGFFETGFANYVIKLLLAIGLTPMIYLLHFFIDKHLGKKESETLIDESASESLKD